jgi:NAD+--asparagine ADP-ribosyltransferase
MTNNNRQLVEKVTYLEKDLSERRLDYENEKSLYQNKVFEAQNELQQLRSTSKIAEEKLKLIEQEKHRVEASLQAQLK